jgi:uncharacterized protein YfcZ (UPF0381/DUF406 family)
MSFLDLLRERRTLWVSGLVFLLANLALFSAYRLLYAGRVDLLSDRLNGRSGELATLVRKREALDRKLEQATEREAQISELYDVRFATEAERLTSFITEVKDLARRSLLDPKSISYPTETLEDYGIVERGFVFSVEGQYEGLRQFINLLENADSFLMLQQVSLGETGGDSATLRIQLRIATLFKDDRKRPGKVAVAAKPAEAVVAVSEGDTPAQQSETGDL